MLVIGTRPNAISLLALSLDFTPAKRQSRSSKSNGPNCCHFCDTKGDPDSFKSPVQLDALQLFSVSLHLFRRNTRQFITTGFYSFTWLAEVQKFKCPPNTTTWNVLNCRRWSRLRMSRRACIKNWGVPVCGLWIFSKANEVAFMMRVK